MVIARLPEWTRVHLSSVAVESLAQTLELLHPEGVLQLQDLFVRDASSDERLLTSDEELLSATAAL
jgi:hypothetical protein